jgi:hypothetical protein
LTGTITPFESPPPNFKSLFDFSLAGPLVGAAASLVFMIVGLRATVAMSFEEQSLLPGLPASLIKSSALGGEIVAYFLGSGVVKSLSPESLLTMHPFAISGFMGLIINSLALLPLGREFYSSSYCLEKWNFFSLCETNQTLTEAA